MPRIRARPMFGGVGIYSGDIFFALIATTLCTSKSMNRRARTSKHGEWAHSAHSAMTAERWGTTISLRICSRIPTSFVHGPRRPLRSRGRRKLKGRHAGVVRWRHLESSAGWDPSPRSTTIDGFSSSGSAMIRPLPRRSSSIVWTSIADCVSSSTTDRGSLNIWPRPSNASPPLERIRRYGRQHATRRLRRAGRPLADTDGEHCGSVRGGSEAPRSASAGIAGHSFHHGRKLLPYGIRSARNGGRLAER